MDGPTPQTAPQAQTDAPQVRSRNLHATVVARLQMSAFEVAVRSAWTGAVAVGDGAWRGFPQVRKLRKFCAGG